MTCDRIGLKLLDRDRTRQYKTFNVKLIRLVGWINLSLLMKIQWREHHNLHVKIVYKHDITNTQTLFQRTAYHIPKTNLKHFVR